MSFSPETLRQALQVQAGHYTDLLNIASEEERALRNPDHYTAGAHDTSRRRKLREMDQTLVTLRDQRLSWQSLSPTERAKHPEIHRLIRTTQELGMKVIRMDRGNEQSLLRRGLLPARCLPSAESQRPNYVTGLYQRNQS